MSSAMKPVNLIEAAIFVAGRPLTLNELQATVLSEYSLSASQIKSLIDTLDLRYQDSGIELVETALGFRFQARREYSANLASLWHEKAPKLSRAMLETLTLIAYRQPITRGEIEAIRGVAVSSNMIQHLHERSWIHKVGQKDVPGRPALYATTQSFLDYFGMKKLEQLPELDQSLLDKLPQDFQT